MYAFRCLAQVFFPVDKAEIGKEKKNETIFRLSSFQNAGGENSCLDDNAGKPLGAKYSHLSSATTS